jgi:uncharacterized protein (DUF302 family)
MVSVSSVLLLLFVVACGSAARPTEPRVVESAAQPTEPQVVVKEGEVISASLVRVDKVSGSSFDKTVSRLETAISAKGNMIVATVDHQNMASMVGLRLKGSKTLEFGKPDMLKEVLAKSPEAGLEAPARIYVYENTDGKTVVSYYKPSVGFASYGKDHTNMAGQMMDQMLEEIVAEGTK